MGCTNEVPVVICWQNLEYRNESRLSSDRPLSGVFKRGYDVISVRTKDLYDKIQQACKVRNDEWVETARGRSEFAQDLHAADTVYHQACSVNFRTENRFRRNMGMTSGAHYT